MKLSINANYSELPLITARHFLKCLEFEPKSHEQKTHYAAFTLTDSTYDCDNKFSLIDNFALYNKAMNWIGSNLKRSIIYIANDIGENYPIERVEVFNAGKLDCESRIFFEYLYRIHKIEIVYYQHSTKNIEQNIKIDSAYEDLLGAIQINNIPLQYVDTFHKYSSTLLGKGIPKLVITINQGILAGLYNADKSGDNNNIENIRNKCYRFLVTACIMAADTIKAEYFCHQWLNNSNIEYKLEAKTVLTFIKLEYHSEYLRDEVGGRKLLEELFEEVNTNPDIDTSEDLQLLRVFIINAYASLLEKDNKLEQVYHLMEWGLKNLDKFENTPKLTIYRYILMYNIAMYNFKENKIEIAEKQLRKITKTDCFCIDFYLDIAKAYIEVDLISNAEKELKKALKMNPSLHEIYALLANCEIKRNSYYKAKEYYKKASIYSSKTSNYLYQYLTVLYDLGRYKDVIKLIENDMYKSVKGNSTNDIAMLLVKSYALLGEVKKIKHFTSTRIYKVFTSDATKKQIQDLYNTLQNKSLSDNIIRESITVR